MSRVPAAAAAPAEPTASPSPDTVHDRMRALQAAAGNRGMAALARAGSPGCRQLQRMLLHMHARGESAEERDKLLSGAAMLAKKASRGRQVRVQEDGTGLDQLGSIAPDETIYVIAHSDGVQVWGLDPAAFAARLFALLPDGYRGRIKLMACHSGEARPAKGAYRAALAETTTYAQELAHELALLQQGAVERAIAIPTVLGRPGVGTIDPATGRPRVYPTSAAFGAVKASHDAWVEHELAGDIARLTALESEGTDVGARIDALVEDRMDPTVVAERSRLFAADDAALAEVEKLESAHTAAATRAQNMAKTMPGDNRTAVAGRTATAALAKLEAARLAQANVRAAFDVADQAYQSAYSAASAGLKGDPEMQKLKKLGQKARWEHVKLKAAIGRRRRELESGATAGQKVSELQLSVGQALEGKDAGVVYAVTPGAPRVRHAKEMRDAEKVAVAPQQPLDAPALKTLAPIFAEDFLPRPQLVGKVVAEGTPIVPPADLRMPTLIAVHVVQEAYGGPPGDATK